MTVTPETFPQHRSSAGRHEGVAVVVGDVEDRWPAPLLLDDDEHVLVVAAGGPLLREAVHGGLEVLMAGLEPTELHRRRVAAIFGGPPERAERAARLLAALEAAGSALGVDPEDWRAVTSLPSACWDVAR
jgi:hypothetical protein